ncbi:MAG: hypothetical protein LUE14_08615 [Clostridiales bacterium]|nr:hypothetical protein [Clostridiales bacterium]
MRRKNSGVNNEPRGWGTATATDFWSWQAVVCHGKSLLLAGWGGIRQSGGIECKGECLCLGSFVLTKNVEVELQYIIKSTYYGVNQMQHF